MSRNRKTPEQKADLAVLEMINVAQIRAGRPQTGADLGMALGVSQTTGNAILNNPGKLVEPLRRIHKSYRMPVDEMLEYLRRAIVI
jgi:hypothetical protein